jgi:hypothetical protein
VYILTQDKKRLICFDIGDVHIEGNSILYKPAPNVSSILLGSYESENRSQRILEAIYVATSSGKPAFSLPEA